MWLWILIGLVFAALIAKSWKQSAGAGSRPLGLLAALLDSVAMLAMLAGAFYALLVLGFGVLAGQGPRLSPTGLADLLVWAGLLMALSLLCLVAGSFARRAAGP